MRIAIVGAGISGLVAAALLGRRHEVTVFEANAWIGGHTHTVDVDSADGPLAVDTGFIVFNDRTYPNFTRLLEQLGVASQTSSMSFSVRCDRTGLEYNGTSLNRLFAQRRNLLRPSFLGMVRDILRFHREAPAVLDADEDGTMVGEYVATHRYGQAFVEHYLVPMGAAIWSCPPRTFRRFPVRFVVEFFRNHGMLSVDDRPTWRVVSGGSRRYVEALTRPFRERIHRRRPVRSVLRDDDAVHIVDDTGHRAAFDHVVLACHGDQALALLAAPTDAERVVLGSFPYQRNTAVLHTDTSVLPRRRRAWASWNYHLLAGEPGPATVTYNMNILQGLATRAVYCVTLNEPEGIDASRVLGRYTYEHPVYTTARAAAQRRHHELIDANRTSYCGAYWGYGFHEDGVNSALAVGRAFGETLG